MGAFFSAVQQWKLAYFWKLQLKNALVPWTSGWPKAYRHLIFPISTIACRRSGPDDTCWQTLVLKHLALSAKANKYIYNIWLILLSTFISPILLIKYMYVHCFRVIFSIFLCNYKCLSSLKTSSFTLIALSMVISSQWLNI